MTKKLLNLTIFFCLIFLSGTGKAAAEEMLLRNNLVRAQAGDYLVTMQNKNYTVLLIQGKQKEQLTIEEVTVPMARIPSQAFSWRSWLANGAPGHTCWVIYTIDLPTGTMQHTYSYTRKEWISIPKSQNFLSTLLNLNLQQIPLNERKKIGPPPLFGSKDQRAIWQPHLIIDGKAVQGVAFDGWRTRWPKDGSELADKTIEVYLPQKNEGYPSYFPYWLQISGMLGKAKVRIVDSGSGLLLPSKIPLR